MYSPGRVRQWERSITAFATKEWDPKGPEEGPVSLTVRAFFPSRKPARKRVPRPQEWHHSKPDLDNILKAVMDALEGVVYRNDSQVARIVCEKHRAAQGEEERTEIEIERIP